MSTTIAFQMAKHFRDVHFGGNWTVSCLKDQVEGITWQQAITKVESFNTIATLVYHTHYFVLALNRVLKGSPLDANDKFSFDHPPIQSPDDWKNFLEQVFLVAHETADLIGKIPEDKLMDVFEKEKYGTYYRNIHGIIEHTHYHLGQIALIKKMIISNT